MQGRKNKKIAAFALQLRKCIGTTINQLYAEKTLA
jgi:hypothetical protein